MKKISILLVSILIVCGALYLILTNQKEEEIPRILTQLEETGDVNGKRQFLFTLKNLGKEKATLKFPTWLEYNVTIDNLDNQEIPSGAIIMEHKDLDENKTEGRTIELKPNESLNYRLLITTIPKGKYEITIDSATDYGGTHSDEFIIN